MYDFVRPVRNNDGCAFPFSSEQILLLFIMEKETPKAKKVLINALYKQTVCFVKLITSWKLLLAQL